MKTTSGAQPARGGYMVTKSDIQALLEDGPEQAAQLAERLETAPLAAAARRPCPATRRCGVRGGMERHRTAARRRRRCWTRLHTFGHPLLHRQTRIAAVPAVWPTEPDGTGSRAQRRQCVKMAVTKATTSNGRIISLSLCSRMWRAPHAAAGVAFAKRTHDAGDRCRDRRGPCPSTPAFGRIRRQRRSGKARSRVVRLVVERIEMTAVENLEAAPDAGESGASPPSG